ncbi:unnamed protein product [Diamesa tonsa]
MDQDFGRGGEIKVARVKKTQQFGIRNVEEKKREGANPTKRERVKDNKSKSVTKNGETEREVYSAKPLNLTALVPDMILMGVVKTIQPLYLLISLPGRLVGRVPISSISKAYTNLLQTVLENQDLTTKPKALEELFTLGQIVYVKVINKCHGPKEEILLSLLPHDINSEINSGVLAEGNVLLCAVQEVEDHGYIMETGIKNVKAFLPKKSIKTSPNIGEFVYCRVQKITPSSITLYAFSKNEPLKINTADVPNMKTLVPGSIITFTVARILKNGLEGLIFDGSLSAYANEVYLTNKTSLTDSQVIGKEVRARILYVMPLSNQIMVSLNCDEGKSKPKLQFGTLIEDAKVIKQTTSGILLKLNGNEKGILPRKALIKNLKNNFDIDSALIKYSPNSHHAIRVMDFNPIENLYLCTNDGKLLHEKYFATYDLHCGDIVTAKVEEKITDGFQLAIGNVRGFLKNIFLHPAAKITVGDEIKVRVAEVDHSSKIVQVTNLSAFLKNTARILSAKKDIKEGKVFTGVVLKDTPKLYLILFFNHIRAAVQKTPENIVDITNIGGLKVGAVRHFEIKNVRGDRISLTLPKTLDTDNLGKIFDCKVTSVLPTGLQVFIEQSKSYGKIPTNFLSEFAPLSSPLSTNIRENDRFQVAALSNNVYSRRDVDYYGSGAIVDFEDVKPGSVLRCYVKSVFEEVIELECPLRNFKGTIKLTKSAFDDPEITLTPDEIVYVNVIAKNESHHNSLYVTPSLHKVWNTDMEVPMQMVLNYLEDVDLLLLKLKRAGKPVGNLKVGQRVTGKVTCIVGNNLVIELENGVFAQGGVENVGAYKVGSVVKSAAIVWIDPVQQMAFVTLREKCIEEISETQEVGVGMVNEKKHKAIIVYFNEYITVSTIRKANQPLIYAPTKFHYNDYSPVTNRAIGNAASKLTIKKNSNGKLIGVFVQDNKIFKKVEKYRTKLMNSLGKRKLEAEVKVDPKKTKVEEQENLDESELKTESEKSDAEEEVTFEKPTKDGKKNVLSRLRQIPAKGKNLTKNVTGTLKRTAKSTLPLKKKGSAILKKDVIVNQELVNLVSYKAIKEGDEEKPTSSPSKSTTKFTQKKTKTSGIKPKLKQKRLGK